MDSPRTPSSLDGRSKQVTPEPDPFSTPEETECLLKSLISSTGLQSAWGSVGKRLKRMEEILRRQQASVTESLSTIVPRTEYHECVEVEHAGKLVWHGQRLEKLGGLASGLEAKCVKHNARLGDLEDRIKRLEKLEAHWKKEIDTLRARAEDHYSEVNGIVDDRAVELFAKMEADMHVTRVITRDIVQEGLAQADLAIAAIEERANAFTMAAEERVRDLLSSDFICLTKMRDERLNILEAADKDFVAPVRREFQAKEKEVSELKEELLAKMEALSVNMVHVDARSNENAAKLDRKAAAFKLDCNSRAPVAYVKEFEATFHKTAEKNNSDIESLKGLVVMKLNEVVEYFAKLNQTIGDHEHCLQHHAEELENRSTKYDLLSCQNMVLKCAMKDNVDSELKTFRGLIDWQTTKMENMNASPMGKKSRGPKKRSGTRTSMVSTNGVSRPASRGYSRQNTKPLSAGSSDTEVTGEERDSKSPSRRRVSKSPSSSPIFEEPVEAKPTAVAASDNAVASSKPASRIDSAETMPAELAALAAAVASPTTLAATAIAVGATVSSALAGVATLAASVTDDTGDNRIDSAITAGDDYNTLADRGLEDSEHDYDADELSEDYLQEDNEEVPSVVLLKQQLESMAMAVVGIAHMVLREPKLGTSRQMRLEQQRELIEQLHDLRHWVVHSVAPAGWCPMRLTTLALQYAHDPREEDCRSMPLGLALARAARPESAEFDADRVQNSLSLADASRSFTSALPKVPKDLPKALPNGTLSHRPSPFSARAQTAGVNNTPTSPRPPFSARGALRDLGVGSHPGCLPPLKGLACGVA